MPRVSSWRRHFYAVYTVLFLLVFLAQLAAALGLFVLGVPLAAASAAYPLPYLLVPVVILAFAFVLLLLNALEVTRQAYRAGREALGERERELWLKRWTTVMFGGSTPPPGPLARPSMRALLELKDSLDGEEAEMAFDLSRYYGVEAGLVKQAQARRGARVPALEALGTLRSPETLPLLLEAAQDRHPLVHDRALRALARTVAAMPAGQAREEAAAALLAELRKAALPLRSAEEVLMLLGEAARTPVAEILQAYTSESFQRLALEVAGRRKFAELADEVARFAASPNPELRASALRALGRMGALPHAARTALEKLSQDEHDFVRAQAARVVALLPEPQAVAALAAALGDRSWWVRVAAAQALAGLGDAGQASLARAAREHPDRYGRDAARQALLDLRLRSQGARA